MLFSVVRDLNKIARNVIPESEMNKAHLALKVSSLAGASVIYDDGFLILVLLLVRILHFACALGNPLKEILQRIILGDDLGIDPGIRDLREELLRHGVASDIIVFPVENDISEGAEFIDLLLNAQINVIDRGSRDNVIKDQCADKIEERDYLVLQSEEASSQIDQHDAEKRTGICNHEPEGSTALAEIGQDGKECRKSDFNSQYDVSDVIDLSGFFYER